MHFLYYFLLHFLCAFFITPTVFTWLRKIPQKLTSRRYFRPVALFVEPLPTVGGFEALGGVVDAAECRHAVDSDILEFVTVAVVRRLMGHARIERIAQCRILLRDVPAMHAHLAPGGGMPPSAAPSATSGEVLHIARKLAYLVLELVLGEDGQGKGLGKLSGNGRFARCGHAREYDDIHDLPPA